MNNAALSSERIILGIDPGTTVMGYGLIHQQGKNISLITMGVLKLSKYKDHALKLKKIFERTLGLIEEYHPDELAIEAPFFGKNVQSMLKLGRAQGVAMAAGLYKELPIFEYSPKKIKQSITGNGNASKEQVAAMLANLVVFKEEPEFLDATDGLAAAVCHYFQGGYAKTGKNYSGWKSFLKDNPDRVG
jgi:crossover junction endodeoxyribonuclease RuvC